MNRSSPPDHRPQEPPRAQGPQPTNWQLIRRLLLLAWQYRLGCLVVLAMQAAVVAFQLFGLGLAGVGIDYIRYRIEDPERVVSWMGIPFSPEAPVLQVLTLVALGVLGMALVRAGLRFSTVLSAAKLAQRIVVYLRSQVYRKLQRLSFRFFDAHESGTIINRVTGDVQHVRMFVDNVLLQIITLLITLTAYLVFMFSIHVWLTLAVLATTPLLYVSTVVFARVVRPIYLLTREKLDHTIRTLAESIQGIHVIKCFAREQEQVERFIASNTEVRNTRQRVFWKTSIFVPTVGFITQINMIVLMLYGGHLAINGQIPLGAGLVVFAELLRQFANQITMIANITNSIQMSLTGAQRVFEILDTPVEIQSKPDAIRTGRLEGEVEFDRVTFGYDPSHAVIEDVSFHVAPKQCVAIVGTTGAGKSTVLALIPRFYDVQAGAVRIDGIDVRDMNLDELRRNIGLVFQESFLFSTTVAENIAYGHPDATRQQVVEAAHIAAADEFIQKLPEGYDTVIGENGIDLSGGQRQRIAIARAVLLQPPILLLDDATSAIDPETEHEIMAAMDNAMEGRTTFVVAHRLSTLRRADQVIVLDRGRVVQAGTHDELMNERGHYRRAARMQVADAESLRVLEEVAADLDETP